MYCLLSLFLLPILVAMLAIILLLVNKMRTYFRLSETDELTFLPNYRGFRRKLNPTLRIHTQKGTDFSIAILDIDGFRRFNDQSYALGDVVLQDFVSFLKQELPVQTFMARFRLGDEFVLILPFNAAETSEKLNGIARKSQQIVHQKEGQQMEYTLSFSFGVAGFAKDKDSVETMLEKAEKALKENKKLKQA